LRPDREFYQRELVDLSHENLFLIQRALRRLIDAGLVHSTKKGSQTYYGLNREFPVLSELRAIVFKTFGLGDALKEALEPRRSQIATAFVFGSAARGDDTSLSDIDLFVIGDVSARQLASAISPVQRTLSREINTALYPLAEFRKKALSGHHFITEVLTGPKTFIVGSERDLKRITGRRAR
jgi:predicted nucleotidyltransferase